MYADYRQDTAKLTSDGDFVARIAAGDRGAESEFIKRYARGVEVLVRRHCRPGDSIVEDLTQDVLARVLERLRAGAIRDADALPAYIQATIVNATRAEYRRRRPTDSSDVLESLEAESSPINELSANQLQNALKILLRELPVERDRNVLKLFYFEELHKDDVCRSLNIDTAHFHRVVFRARERFRALLTQAGIEEE